MKLTDEQLLEITGKAPVVHLVSDAAMRIEHARTVIDLALSKMAEGEGDLVTAQEVYMLSRNEAVAELVNTRHRQAMAALRAQMQGEIDECWAKQEATVKEWQAEIARRDQWKERAEKAEAEVQEKAQARYESLLAKKLEWLEKCIAGDVEAFAKMPHAELIDALKSVRLQLPAACHAVINASVDRLSQLAQQQTPADREAFEKWGKAYPCDLRKHENGYADAWTQAAYRGWQAALAHKPQVVEALQLAAAADTSQGCSAGNEAIAVAAMEALKGEPQPWIPCSERMPTREDGDKDGDVLWNWTSLGDVVIRHVDWQYAHEATHWMPIPPLPAAPTAEKVHGGESIDAIDQVPQEKVPPPPEKMSVQVLRKDIDTWQQGDQYEDSEDGWHRIPDSWAGGKVRIDTPARRLLSNTPPLVTFTPEGKINPPPYGSWHRSDWTPEMLPDGWRPLLDGESVMKGDGSWFDGMWIGVIPLNSPQHVGSRYRTRRPLPPAPEKEKEPEWVPLEACDVPPGSVFRLVGSSTQWAAPVDVYTAGAVFYNGSDHFMHKEWSYLMKAGYEISRDNGKTWEACKKIKQP